MIGFWGHVRKKGRRLDRSPQGGRTEKGTIQDEMTRNWEVRQRKKAGADSEWGLPGSFWGTLGPWTQLLAPL